MTSNMRERQGTMTLRLCINPGTIFVLSLLIFSLRCAAQIEPRETLQQATTRLGREMEAVYRQCPAAFLSTDYFARFTRDPDARATENEVEVTGAWRIVQALPSSG